MRPCRECGKPVSNRQEFCEQCEKPSNEEPDQPDDVESKRVNLQGSPLSVFEVGFELLLGGLLLGALVGFALWGISFGILELSFYRSILVSVIGGLAMIVIAPLLRVLFAIVG